MGTLRIEGLAEGPLRLTLLPHTTVGRAPSADWRLDHPAVSASWVALRWSKRRSGWFVGAREVVAGGLVAELADFGIRCTLEDATEPADVLVEVAPLPRAWLAAPVLPPDLPDRSRVTHLGRTWTLHRGVHLESTERRRPSLARAASVLVYDFDDARARWRVKVVEGDLEARWVDQGVARTLVAMVRAVLEDETFDDQFWRDRTPGAQRYETPSRQAREEFLKQLRAAGVDDVDHLFHRGGGRGHRTTLALPLDRLRAHPPQPRPAEPHSETPDKR